MYKIKHFLISFSLLLLHLVAKAQMTIPEPSVLVHVHMSHTANGKKIIPQTHIYFNSLKEPYSITRLRYYISNPGFDGHHTVTAILIDAFAKDSFSILMPPGKFKEFNFTLGIDSSTQSNGAQSGDLDVMNGMYWTWNSGYINFKLEGFSDSSTADLHRIEHHIGGYRHPFATDKTINLAFTHATTLKENRTYHLYIELNLDAYFSNPSTLSFKEDALIMSSGPTALRAANNFGQMFLIKKITAL